MWCNIQNSLVLNKKSISKIISIEFYYAFFWSAAVDFLHFPTSISYGLDLLNLIVLFFLLYARNSRQRINGYKAKSVYFSAILLMIFCCFSAVLNLVPFPQFLLSCRNALRFFPFFFSVFLFWDEARLQKLVRFLVYFQLVNFLIIIYQHYALGFAGDYLGGIFGNNQGCNGYLNIYMCITVALVIERFLHKNEKLWMLVFTCVSWMLVAALAELKVAFIEIPIIIMIAVLLDKPSFKTVVVVFLVVIAVVMGINLIVLKFPQWANSFTSVNALLAVGSNIGGDYNISRTNAFSEINRLFFDNSIFYNIFGLGFGNCEYSSVGMLTSEFYKSYGFLNYGWFSHQMWFLQCGYIGVIGLFSFLANCAIWITKNKHIYKDEYGYGSFGQILMIILMINFVYNATFITEIGYIAFMALAIPFVYYKGFLISETKN